MGAAGLSFLPPEVIPSGFSFDVRIDAIRDRMRARGWGASRHKAFSASSLEKGGRVAVFRVEAGSDGEEFLGVSVYTFDGGSFFFVGMVVDNLLERPAAVADRVGDMSAGRVLSCGERASYICGSELGL